MSKKYTNEKKVMLPPNHNLLREWGVSSSYLGKILIIVAPHSSGKSTLVTKILEKIPNTFTINRKELLSKHIPHIISVAEETFCSNLLLEARSITGKPIKSSLDLHYLKPEELSERSTREALIKLKHDFKKVSSSKEFDRFVLLKLFTEYYYELRKYIFSGQNIILDEGIVNSQEAIDIFRYCCHNYSGVKIAVLFNTLEDNLKKCIVRNTKFAELLDKFSWAENPKKAMEATTLKSGDSSEIYRFPLSIIDNYSKYYEFKPSPGKKDKILAKISAQQAESFFYHAEKEQLKLIGLLGYKNYERTLETGLKSRKQQVSELMQSSETAYIVSKSNYDYYINASYITDTTLLDNLEFLRFLLGDIIPWLTGTNIVGYTKEATRSLISRRGKQTKEVGEEENDSIFYKSRSVLAITGEPKQQGATTLVIDKYLNLRLLMNSLNIVGKHSLTGQKTTILIGLGQDKWAEFVASYSCLNTLMLTYHDPRGVKLEKSDLSLIVLAGLYFKVNSLDSSHNYNVKVVDLSQPTALIPDIESSLQKENSLDLLVMPSFLEGASTFEPIVELRMWSKCVGKIFVINGVSSAGKTTLAYNVVKKLGLNKLSADDAYDCIFISLLTEQFPSIISFINSFLSFEDLKKILLQYTFDKGKYGASDLKVVEQIEAYVHEKRDLIFDHFSSENLYKVLSEQARKLILEGESVIIDMVITTNEEYILLKNYFDGCSVMSFLLYAPLEDNVHRCLVRNDQSSKNGTCDYRSPTTVITQYLQLYQLVPYDSSSTYKFLDSLSKSKILEILTFVKEESNKLLTELFENNISSNIYLKNKLLTEEKIEKAFEFITSLLSEEFFILPKISSNYVLQNTEAYTNGSDVSLLNPSCDILLSEQLIALLGEILNQ